MKTRLSLLVPTLLILLRPLGAAGLVVRNWDLNCGPHTFFNSTCNGTNYFGYTHWDEYGIDSCDQFGYQVSCASIATNPIKCVDGWANFNSAWGVAPALAEMLGGPEGYYSVKCPVKLFA